MSKEVVIAKNVKDALSKNKNGYSFFAGGTEIERLNSPIKASKFVSLKNCNLKNIEIVQENGLSFLKIGANVSFQELLNSEQTPEKLKNALLFCSSLQKRYMATIAGNIASFRDDSYLISTLIAYSAEVEIEGEKTRFDIVKYGTLKNRDNLLIKNIYIPHANRKIYNYRYAITQSSHSVINMAVSCSSSLSDFIIAVNIKTFGLLRLYDVEAYLNEKDIKSFRDDDFDALKDFIFALPYLDIKNDLIYGSGKYKKYLIYASLREAIEELSV